MVHKCPSVAAGALPGGQWTRSIVPPTKGRAPTSWHICPKWSTVKYGFPTGSVGATVSYRIKPQHQPRQILTSRVNPCTGSPLVNPQGTDLTVLAFSSYNGGSGYRSG